MDALIKDESMDFATLNFGKVEKNPEITAFSCSSPPFFGCEAGFLREILRNFRVQIAKRRSPKTQNGTPGLCRLAIRNACYLFVTPDHWSNRHNRFSNFLTRGA
jgi:hypothetical protein